jgi:hypothetical protein
MNNDKLVFLDKLEVNSIEGGYYIVGFFNPIRRVLGFIDDVENFLDGFEEGYNNTCSCENL